MNHSPWILLALVATALWACGTPRDGAPSSPAEKAAVRPTVETSAVEVAVAGVT